MNSAIELHDSECLVVESDSVGNGTIVLDAYVHRSDGEPCKTPGEGGVQRVRFFVEFMRVVGEVGTLPGTIYGGSLEIDGSNLDLIPLPFSSVGSCNLRLSILDGSDFYITGKNMQVISEGDFRFVEHNDFSAN
ncbi:MAG TPA: hypothetical protein VFU55_06510 [Terracidiphilus sp.]|nr:hypothetical protein [Terracidiphilus sp.]